MPPTSTASPAYFLALNGTPHGPHSAAAVLQMLQQGHINGATLICQEGGPAWLPLSQAEMSLRMAVQPQPPAIQAVPQVMPAQPPAVMPGTAPVQTFQPPPQPFGPPGTVPQVAMPGPAPVAPAQPPPQPFGPPGTVPQPGMPGTVPVQTFRPPPQPFGPPDPAAANQPAVPAAMGYGGGGAPVRRYEPKSQSSFVPPAPPPDNSKGLRFVTMLGALVLFFLPWIEVSCSVSKTVAQNAPPNIELKAGDLRMLKQTGLEAIMGGGGFDDDFFAIIEKVIGSRREMASVDLAAERRKGEEKFVDEVGHAWFAAGAMACVVIGLLAGFAKNGRQMTGIFALAAMICLGAQMISGFKLHTKMEESKREVSQSMSMSNEQQMFGRLFLGASHPKDLMKTGYSYWFYAEWGLLAVAMLTGFSGQTQRRN